MSVKPYASDLIRSMRGKLRDAGHGGLVLRSEDAIAWERSLNTILALVEELEEEKTSLERRLGGAGSERTKSAVSTSGRSSFASAGYCARHASRLAPARTRSMITSARASRCAGD